MTLHVLGGAMPAPTCEVCGRSGAESERCRFGADGGPCTCWRGEPCHADPARSAALMPGEPCPAPCEACDAEVPGRERTLTEYREAMAAEDGNASFYEPCLCGTEPEHAIDQSHYGRWIEEVQS